MAQEGSVAPRERVNIRYETTVGNAREEVELPLKMLVLGDFTGRPNPAPLEERTPIAVNKENFEQVLKEQQLAVTLKVRNRLSGGENDELVARFKVEGLKDFAPEHIAAQVPELARLLDLRQALSALKAPLGNLPAFREHIQSMLKDPAARDRLLDELKGVAD